MSAKLKISFIIIAAVFIIPAIQFLQQEETVDIQPEHNPCKEADHTIEIIKTNRS